MGSLSVHHLERDHRAVHQSLSRLETLLDEQERSSAWTPQFAEDFHWLVNEIGEQIERYLRKEEESLYPALEAYLPREVGPLSVLRTEHADTREALRLLRHAVEARNANQENPAALEGVRHYSRLVIQIVHDHSYKEGRVLFPMMTRFFSREKDALIVRQMEEIDRAFILSPAKTDQGPGGVPHPNNDSPRILSRGRRAPMVIDKKDLIERLKLEVQVIEMGGYSPSVRDPHTELRIFRDSVSCPNLGLQEKVEPCTHCYLMEFVPPEHQEKEDACNHIPLNERGDTLDSLQTAGNREKAQAAVLAWLKAKIAELEA